MRQIALFLLLLVLPNNIMAETRQQLATLFSLDGSATVTSSTSVQPTALKNGDPLFAGDLVKTAALSRAGIQFSDGGFVRLGSNAALQLEVPSDNTEVSVSEGNAYFFSRSPRLHPKVTTPTVSAAMRGTEFSLNVSANSTTVAVLEGSVELTNAQGSVLCEHGEGAIIKLGQAPVKQLVVNLPNTVQWMVQVPFIGSWSDYTSQLEPNSELALTTEALMAKTAYSPGTQTQREFWLAAQALESSDLRMALARISAETKVAALQLLRARLLLTLGEVEQGSKVLRSLLQSPLANSALASLALVEISQGDLNAARSHLSVEDTSNFSFLVSRALLAQGDRDLELADSYLAKAQALSPSSTLIKVRRAELALAQGELDEASALLADTDQKNPGYADAIRGFVALAKGDTSDALSDFNRALSSPDGSALALLGSALAHTTLGEQQKGISLFQQAALLEPKNSMLRSYLGKSFSEATDEASAEKEYALAIALDENDPTPWFYRSYSRIAQNRPVEALSDIEESIERNENRSIYRSSFLLDQDSAVRSANLARVFNELGFVDAGRIEAIKSISKQYSNFSAHRLLADTQDTIFLADAAFSERRISDLMAPLSLNLFDSVSGSVTLNEYSALFERDQTRFALGNDFNSFDDLYAPSLLVAGKDGRFGYSFTAGAANRDGSAQYNSNQDYRVGSMLQYQPDWRNRFSLSTTGQFFRTRDSNAYEQQVDLRRFGADLGYLHTFSPGLIAVASSSVQRTFDNADQFGAQETIVSSQIFSGQEDSTLSDIIADRSRNSYLTSVLNQFQLIADGSLISSVIGASHNRLISDRFDDPTVLQDSLGELDGLGVKLPSSQENQLSTYSLYNYHTAHLTDWAHFTAGASYEHTQRDLREIPPFLDGKDSAHRFSPKFGLVMNPISSLTLRSSYGEGVRKAVLEDQISIEPTMIGGINQRFNDLSGTENRQFGLGVDWKAPKSTYLGVEWSRRHIVEPITFATNEFVVDFDTESNFNSVQLDGTSRFHAEQDFVRSYFSQVLSDRFVATFDHRYAMQRFTDRSSFERLEDHRSSATLKYFDSSGLILFSRALWRYQERLGSLSYSDGTEPFWHFDVGAGYRLPGRKGIVRLELRNLLDKSFDLDQSAGFYEVLSPSRAVFVTARFNY